jgi:hypothetical protein
MAHRKMMTLRWRTEREFHWDGANECYRYGDITVQRWHSGHRHWRATIEHGGEELLASVAVGAQAALDRLMNTVDTIRLLRDAPTYYMEPAEESKP